MARNELDQKLYEFVQSEIWPKQVVEYGGEAKLRDDMDRETRRKQGTWRRLRHIHNVTHRNIFYKPFVFLNGRGKWQKKHGPAVGGA